MKRISVRSSITAWRALQAAQVIILEKSFILQYAASIDRQNRILLNCELFCPYKAGAAVAESVLLFQYAQLEAGCSKNNQRRKPEPLLKDGR